MKRRRKKRINTVQGLGVRYGVNVRKKYARVINEKNKHHKCPQCGLPSVKRESVGVWVCKHCNLRFSGGAYTTTTKIGVAAIRSAKDAKI